MNGKTTLRTIFNQAACDYDKVRPGYPEKLIEDIIAISELPQSGRILEIGCGTGQATIPFAKRGYSMLCLDIGKELATLACENCRQYSNVQIRNMSFEDWNSEANSFDIVISATAFHWIPPDIGYPKVAQVLKDSGYMAIFRHHHPTPYTGFFQAVQKVYQSVVPEWKAPSDGPSTEQEIRSTEDYINRTGLFEKVLVKHYPWSKMFDKVQYLKLLNTFSGHRNLEEARRLELFTGIGALIESEFGGTIARPYLSVLYLAKKKSHSTLMNAEVLAT
jgi:SAM-dependent methyltransferase